MLAIISLTIVLSAAPAELTAGDHRRTVTVNDVEREFIVHVPKQKTEIKKWPVVLAFHGAASNADGMVRFSGLNEKSDQAGFLVVYPNGSGRLDRLLTWNGGECCGYAQTNKIDDVKFIGIILDELAKLLPIDENRIFATGMSNGGIFSYYLASELSERIAAIAPVAGTMATATCSPKRPVSVCHFHGTKDEFVPYPGGRGVKTLQLVDFHSVDYSIQAWVKANGCNSDGKTTKIENKVDDGMAVTQTFYGGGKENSEVVLYTIEGAGHTWPGREFIPALLGPSTKNISANDIMWDFFLRHGRK